MKCIEPSCKSAPQFRVVKTKGTLIAELAACPRHTDLFHEATLAVKYGDWDQATFSRISGRPPVEES